MFGNFKIYVSKTIMLVKQETIMKIRKYFGLSDNKNITYQKLQNIAKAVLRGNLHSYKQILEKKNWRTLS